MSARPTPHARRLLLVLALSLVLLLTTTFATMAAPVFQETDDVTIGQILINLNEFEDETVTVSGEATFVEPDANLFILESNDRLRLDRLTVLASPEMLQDLQTNDQVEVTGIIRRFVGDFGSEIGLDLDEQVTDALQNRAVLVADEISMETATEVGEDVVILIGARAITEQEFDQRFMNVVRTIAARQGIPLNDETMQLFEGLRSQYLEQVATEETLLAEAERRGITVSDEELQTQIDEISERFESEEAFQSALEEAGFESEEAFRAFIRNSEIMRRVGEEIQSEIEATDEEILSFYEDNPEFFTTETGLIPFEQVEDPIRSQLERQLYNARLLDLREDIELRIFAENLNPMENGENDGE